MPDDLYTDGLEPLLDGLGAYPNVEIRWFNPFPTRGSIAKRFAAAMLVFARPRECAFLREAIDQSGVTTATIV